MEYQTENQKFRCDYQKILFRIVNCTGEATRSKFRRAIIIPSRHKFRKENSFICLKTADSIQTSKVLHLPQNICLEYAPQHQRGFHDSPTAKVFGFKHASDDFFNLLLNSQHNYNFFLGGVNKYELAQCDSHTSLQNF